MYFCLNCLSRFEEPTENTWGEVTVKVCPYCKDNDYEKLEKCKLCSTYILSPEDYCEPHKIAIAEWMLDAFERIQATTDSDRQDVLNAMGAWMEKQ